MNRFLKLEDIMTIKNMMRAGLAAAAILAIGTGAVISNPTPASAAKIKIKLGHPLPPPTALHKWAVMLKTGLERRIGDKVEMQIFPVSQLGSIPRMIEGAQLGTIEMIQMPPAFFTGVDPRFGVLSAPGIFSGIAHGHRTIHDPAFKKAFWPIGERKGLKMIGMSCDADTAYATTKPIRKLADFRGRKLRVFGSKFEIETLKRVGATGVPMPLSEVIPAIQQNTIDGNKAAIVVFVPFKYQTVAKHVLKAKSSIICINHMASKVWYDKLPRGVQTVIMEEAAKADREIISFSMNLNKKLYGIWTKTGGTLAELSDADQAEFNRRLSTVGEAVLKSQPDSLKMYKLMKKVAARTR